MKHQLSLLGGAGLGASLMYLLDPEGGRRRRAMARDKALHGLKAGGRSLRGTTVHLGNKTKGLVAKAAKGRFSLPKVLPKVKIKPRTAALGVGALAGTVGLGLLARNRKRMDDLTRPLTGRRTVRGESSAQLEW